MHDDLDGRVRARRRAQRQRRRAAVIHSQSVKGSEMIEPVPPRLRRGKEDQRDEAVHRRRHVGLLLAVLVTAASVQDRDAAKPLLWNLRKAFPSGQAGVG